MADYPEGFGLFTVEHTTSASAADVYAAFLVPEKIAAWFGPVGWHVPLDTISIDAREGGHYEFMMVNDDDESQTSPVTSTLDELREPTFIRSTEKANRELGFPEDLTMEVHIEETSEGTHFIVKQWPLPEAVFEPAAQGWASSFTKLDAALGA
jgi:uncharacterized protein YndB with AHSA1/START domain